MSHLSDETQAYRIETLQSLLDIQGGEGMHLDDVGYFADADTLIHSELSVVYLGSEEAENGGLRMLVRYNGADANTRGFGWLTFSTSHVYMETKDVVELAFELSTPVFTRLEQVKRRLEHDRAMLMH